MSNVNQEIAEVEDEIRELKAKIRELEAKIREFEDEEKEVSRVMVLEQKLIASKNEIVELRKKKNLLLEM